MTTGQLIRIARKKAKLSQRELGEKLGVSGSMIGQYENNLRNPKRETLEKIAAALNVSISALCPPLNYWIDDNGSEHMEPMEADTPDAFVDKNTEAKCIWFNATPDPEYDYLYKKLEQGTITQDEEERFTELTMQSLENARIAYSNRAEKLLNNYMNLLNNAGQDKVFELIKELLEIPKYRKNE